MLAVRSRLATLFAIRARADARRSDAVARARHGLVRDRLHLHDHDLGRASTSRSATTRNTSLPPVARGAAPRGGARARRQLARGLRRASSARTSALRELPRGRAGVVSADRRARGHARRSRRWGCRSTRFGAAPRRRRPPASASCDVDGRRRRRASTDGRRRSSSPPAQFLDMSDAEKLSRRSFEPFDAGVAVARRRRAPRADFRAQRRRRATR